MRKRIFNFAVLAAATGILAACSSYEEIPAAADLSNAEARAVDSITVTFNATFEQPEDTRTSLDESNWKVKWSAEDKVTVIRKGTYKNGKSNTTKYFCVNGTVDDITTDGFSASIIASFPEKTSNNEQITYSGDYYAVYPAIPEAQNNNQSISTSLISEQTATASTFADNVNLAAARSTNKDNLHFQNLCALLSFTVDTDIVSATLTSNSGTPMSGGTATISFSDDTPSINKIESGSSSVKLTGNIVKGKQYYFVVYPGEYKDGFTFEFETSSGKKATMSSTTTLPLSSKGNIFLGDITIPAEKWIVPPAGVYNPDGTSKYEYKKYNDQLVWSVKESDHAFRIQKMDSRQFINISGLHATYTAGAKFTVTVTENLLTDQGSTFNDNVEVISVDSDIIVLKGTKYNYIIKTK